MNLMSIKNIGKIKCFKSWTTQGGRQSVFALQGKLLCSSSRPSTSEAEDIIKLFDEGMNIARFNMSHGTKKEFIRQVKKFREAHYLRPHKTCGLMMDLRGREVRISEVQDGEITLRGGQSIKINVNHPNDISNSETLNVDFRDLPKVVKPKDTLFVDDGKIIL